MLTSSCAAILDTSDTVVTVSEKDWNDQRVLECDKFGRHAAGLSKYSASKTLAERGESNILVLVVRREHH